MPRSILQTVRLTVTPRTHHPPSQPHPPLVAPPPRCASCPPRHLSLHPAHTHRSLCCIQRLGPFGNLDVALSQEAVDVCMEIFLTDQHMQRLQRAFDAIDFEGSGTIDRHEFFEYLEEVRSPFTESIFRLAGPGEGGVGGWGGGRECGRAPRHRHPRGWQASRLGLSCCSASLTSWCWSCATAPSARTTS